MKELGYGQGYRYAHDEADAYAAGENYFPDGMDRRVFYDPPGEGHEAKVRERLERWAELRAKKQADGPSQS
jgi:putative ATPase